MNYMDKNDDDVHVSFITLLLLIQQYNFYNIINNYSTFKDLFRVYIVQISVCGREKKYFTPKDLFTDFHGFSLKNKYWFPY